MISRVGIALVICLWGAIAAPAQVVRFETTMGSFDMVLNPTNDPRLQGHVDNMLAYIEENRYRSSWIHRAGKGQFGEDFVLQMGGSYSHMKRPPPTVDGVSGVFTFDSVTGVPAKANGYSNTVGTVALALPSNQFTGVPIVDAGTSSFFINAKNNDFLDPHFTVFAAIPDPDMAVVNAIMSLPQRNLSADDAFGAEQGFDEVPVMADGKLVFIKRAFVLTDALSVALVKASVQPTMARSAAGGGGNGSSAPLPPLVSSRSASAAVPEPMSAAMLLVGQLFFLGFRRRR